MGLNGDRQHNLEIVVVVRPIQSVKECLERSDPLCQEVFDFLKCYDHEDQLIDFKWQYEAREAPGRFELIKDVIAFANNQGGYIFVGKRNGTWALEGANKATTSAFSNPKSLLGQVNSFVYPSVFSIDAKIFTFEEKKFVLIHVPSSDRLHFLCKDITFNKESRDYSWYRGQTFIRKTEESVLALRDDLSTLVEIYFRKQKRRILEGVSQLIDAGPGAAVRVIGSDEELGPSNTPVAVSWKAITQAPKEIGDALHVIRILEEDEQDVKPAHIQSWYLWKLYRDREIRSQELTEDVISAIAYYSIQCGAPAFFWLSMLSVGRKKEVVLQAAENIRKTTRLNWLLKYAITLGKRQFLNVGKLVKKYKPSFYTQKLRYTQDTGSYLFGIKMHLTREEALRRIDEKIETVLEKRDSASATQEDALTLDAFLYSGTLM